MTTVYVVQDHRRYNKDTGEFEAVHDLTPAKKFGPIRYLLTPTAAPWSPETVIAELWDGLRDFGDADHLLLTGNPILIGWATAVAAQVNGGRLNMLQWNGRERRYISVAAQVFPVDRSGHRE